MFFEVYRHADRVVVLSQEMRALLIESAVPAERIVVVPNWIDTNRVQPCKTNNAFRASQQLDGLFVAMYSGNVGLCQRLEDVLAAAALLRPRHDIRLLIVGEGALKTQLEQQAEREQLTNVTFLPYQPKNQLAESLSAADLHIVPVDPRVTRYLMPSKLYGVLASGTALVAVAPASSDLAVVTSTGGCGLVVEPGDPQALANAICRAADGAIPLAEMGRRGRELAEREYDRAIVTARFGRLLDQLLGREPQPTATDCEELANAAVAHPSVPS
jgi:colanic acid biosynthesis glycosyl transferase WcaI